MAVKLFDGTKTVTTAGTRVQLVPTASNVSCQWVSITARPANTGKIAGGGTGVVAAAGSEAGLAILAPGASTAFEIDDPSQVWIDATINGEGVAFAYGV